ncbi:MAG: HU family DNA-binding protein [Desulfovibrionaceae bacterium]
MNKSELIKAIAETHDIVVDDATKMVNIFFDSVQKTLLDHGRVEIRGFGSFKVKEYPGYQGRNPKTGVQVFVPPKRLPTFKAGKGLLKILNYDKNKNC